MCFLIITYHFDIISSSLYGPLSLFERTTDDIYDPRPGVSLHFSPGTNASNTTMKKKLELLKKGCELRKAIIKKSSLSHDHISLHETEEKFLSSVSEAPNSINDHEGNKNTDALLRFPSNASSISNSSKNATYVVQPLVREGEHDFIGRCKKIEMDKKLVHLAALTSWLNYLLDENSDATNNNEILAKSKKDADLYLRKLLFSRNDIPAMKDNEPQNDISYKCFMAANELSEMRARFRLLYESSPIPNDIVTFVKDGKIAIRMDRRVYADVGLQTELLSLLLSFHPFYLRLGLETILSINIGTRTDFKNQLKTIASVVTQNVFKNPRIMNNRKYMQGRAKILVNNRGAEALLQHFLIKICQFLFIVDKAWRDNAVSRKNRCLFLKWSAYKSISDVVAVLSRELMTGTSNLPKTLSLLGLSLDRKQGFFEQFQYHVTDLLKDLSNGLILGRTVEILAKLQYNTVIHCLRDPGGDRLRKMSNVKTVIDFAKQKGILPEDLYVDIDGIVQGNIDVIIPLLWRFVGTELDNINESDNCDAEVHSISQQLLSLFGISYEIRNPLELANGKLFSLLWKRYYSYGRPFELFDGTTVLEQVASAAEHHFGIPSLMLMKWKNTAEKKTLCLFTKIFISRIYECYKSTSAAVIIQRAFRRYRNTSRMNYDISHKVYPLDQLAESSQITGEDSKRMNASITIQRYCRGWLARTLDQRMKCDKTLQKREAKAVIIQKFIRGWLARTFYQRLLHEQDMRKRENASLIIQKHVRFWLAQKSKMQNKRILQKRENAARVLQSCIRGWLTRIHYRNLLHEISSRRRESAAVTLQKFIRGWLARTFYQRLLHEQDMRKRENASLIIQKHVRFWLAQKSKMQNKRILEKRENAARVLQSCIRGWLTRIHYRNLLHEISSRRRENAAVTLQRHARGWAARKNYREMRYEVALHKQEYAAITFQNSISITECSSDKFKNEIYRCEVISSAKCLRVLCELRRQHNRLRLRRQNFLQAVEDKMKFALLLKTERDRRIKAATTVQAWWRGYLLRKHYVAFLNQIGANRVARQEAASNEERSERKQPIINRVMNAMENLNSERLYIRYKATEVLRKFVGLSELCAQYVFNNGGLECILDSLNGCNRSVGSTEVVIPLCSILWSVLKFKIIRNKLDERRRKDIMKQCYHFMLAFHKVPNVVTNLSAVIVALSGYSEQYKKAPYFVSELAKKFAKLSECDERVTALRKLQKCLLN
uniref:Calponin-homology (CH) domain-containing protein n=1 Tax=Loa loa TaxID=7209 RepID=A0A1I7VUG2_LOALO